jgi:hypothetical protein
LLVGIVSVQTVLEMAGIENKKSLVSGTAYMERDFLEDELDIWLRLGCRICRKNSASWAHPAHITA